MLYPHPALPTPFAHQCTLVTHSSPRSPPPPPPQVCGAYARQPLVTPCGHMGCVDCIATDREHCPLPACRKPYMMQVGEAWDKEGRRGPGGFYNVWTY